MDTSPQTTTEQHTATVSATTPLATATSNLLTLCHQRANLPSFRALLSAWQDPLNLGHLQSVALDAFNETSVLRYLVEKGQDDVVQYLLSYGFDISDLAMAFALKDARETGNQKMLKVLFEGGWDINRPVNTYCPPAMSLLFDQPHLVEYCLSLGANPNARSPSGHSIMQRAVSYASLDMIKQLVQHGATIADSFLLPHAVLAHTQVSSRHPSSPPIECRLPVIKYLLDNGAYMDAFYMDSLSPDVPSGDQVMFGRMTALHFAIVDGDVKLVRLLLEKGATIGLKTWSAWKTNGKLVESVDLARICGQERVIKLLEDWKGQP
ncbi:hypothetical protein N0V90_000352 [Kalmusia sp. IMI 367209]|nr:hypothetical protein N0V90_000352 [Kalmusia sp. IMI 367209]